VEQAVHPPGGISRFANMVMQRTEVHGAQVPGVEQKEDALLIQMVLAVRDERLTQLLMVEHLSHRDKWCC
jgi:hypothetical protein